MSAKYNYYDTVIEDLRYYARDKRRSEEYRMILSTAASALSAANAELKEAQSLISRIGSAMSNTMSAFYETKKYMEEMKNNE